MKIKYLLLHLIITLCVFAQNESQTFLSLKQTGVEDFLKKYPEYDGRGTIVLILDSGVDMGIDGLKLTSTGERKVIDAVDFSRQGDIKFYPAVITKEDDTEYFVNEQLGYKIAGAGKLDLKPANGNYFMGLLDEKLFLNSGSNKPDINENQKKDDKFYFVTFETTENEKSYWVVYFDKNADGNLSDEKPIRNYRDELQEFYIDRKEGVPYLTFAINIFPDKQIVSFFFDDNGHGTHCAGISTGYQIGGAEFNGVAPGAKVIGLKIGNNEFSGGATVTESMKNAYEFADSLSRVLEQPCIINMSYGVGSEIESYAEMEIFLDQLVLNNPHLYICKSAGNDGPGISTVGQPSSSRLSIVTGAALMKDVAGDLYGVIHNENTIYPFSGRGAEINKPDVISPGGCFSTMPNHKTWDGAQGTSMSSPYTAGVVALLMSGVKQKYPDQKISSHVILKALREGADPMPGYIHLDQGGGMINVMKSWELLEKYIAKGEIGNLETYSVTSLSPNLPGNKGQALYIRNGSFLTGKESFSFTIERDNTIKKDKFYRIYDLRSDSEWIKPAQKRTHIRNNQKAYVDVMFDKTKMTTPGLYNGKIFATRQGTKTPEFEMMATVVIPFEFNSANNYSMEWKGKNLIPAGVERYFINIPSGATSMKVKLAAPSADDGRIYWSLFNPEGRNTENSSTVSAKTNEVVEYIFDIYPGVWEIDVVNGARANNSSEYSLKIEFDGINRIDSSPVSKNHNTVEIVNEFNKLREFDLSAEILGYQKTFVKNISGFENIEIPFTISKSESKKTFHISLTKEDFNKNTDFAFLIYDSSGKRIKSNSLSYRDDEISLEYTEGYEKENFVLKIFPGFVHKESEVAVHITESIFFNKTIPVGVKNDGKSSAVFYPSVKEKLTLELPVVEQNIPEGYEVFGNLYFSNKNNTTEYKLPLVYNYLGD